MQITIKWKLKGFSNYFVTNKGWVIRNNYTTNHQHFKNYRFINKNSRNQFTLYRYGAKETWSIKQMRNILVSVTPISMPDRSIIKILPF